MNSMIKYLLAACLVVGLAGLGCNGDDGNNGTDEDTGTVEDAGGDTAEEDTTEEEDATADVAEDTGGEDTVEDTGDNERTLVSDLYYRRKEESCPTSSCTFGVQVNAISGTITKVENGQGLQRTMNNSDTDALIENVMTEATRDKMENGWECGTVDDAAVVHEFEARIWNGNDYEEVIQDVTGCVGTDSTEADADEVQRIITYLQDLRDNYFDQ